MLHCIAIMHANEVWKVVSYMPRMKLDAQRVKVKLMPMSQKK